MLAHLAWKDDHLTITTPRSKSDQSGEFTFPRSIYANPDEPTICPILSLAVHILSRPSRKEGVHPALFDGPDQADRYSKILFDVLSRLPESLAASLGAQRSDIGTHSARKGAPTFALSMPGGPSPVAIFLRAGWSLGNVKDRYIFAGEGGDQLCGRAVCGLSLIDSKFGILPPHFASSTLEMISDVEWKRLLPGYDLYPECFRQVFIFFYLFSAPSRMCFLLLSVFRFSLHRLYITNRFYVRRSRRTIHSSFASFSPAESSRNCVDGRSPASSSAHTPGC